MRFIEAAARIKPERSAVRDQWRVDDVLTKVGETADKVRSAPAIEFKLFINRARSISPKKLPKNYTQILSNPLLSMNWSISTVLPEIISMAGRTTKWRIKNLQRSRQLRRGLRRLRLVRLTPGFIRCIQFSRFFFSALQFCLSNGALNSFHLFLRTSLHLYITAMLVAAIFTGSAC